MTVKGLSIAALLTGAILLALTPAASSIYREAYPTDQTRRAALATCAREDPGFNRLLAGERAQCYVRRLAPAPADTSPLPRRVQVG